jgi:hypothetical protein
MKEPVRNLFTLHHIQALFFWCFNVNAVTLSNQQNGTWKLLLQEKY